MLMSCYIYNDFVMNLVVKKIRGDSEGVCGELTFMGSGGCSVEPHFNSKFHFHGKCLII